MKLGTEWTAPGKGEILCDLLIAFGEPTKPGDEHRGTNLILTGEPITEQDRARIQGITIQTPAQCASCGHDILWISPEDPRYHDDLLMLCASCAERERESVKPREWEGQ